MRQTAVLAEGTSRQVIFELPEHQGVARMLYA
jgi:hypothetical protein